MYLFYFDYGRGGWVVRTVAQKRRWLPTLYVLAYLLAILMAVFTWTQSGWLMTAGAAAPLFMYTAFWRNRGTLLAIGLVLYLTSTGLAIALGCHVDQGKSFSEVKREFYATCGVVGLNMLIATVVTFEHLLFGGKDTDAPGTDPPTERGWRATWHHNWPSKCRRFCIPMLILSWALVVGSAYRVWTHMSAGTYALLAMAPILSVCNAIFMWRHWPVFVTTLLLLATLACAVPLYSSLYMQFKDVDSEPWKLVPFAAYGSVGLVQVVATAFVFAQFGGSNEAESNTPDETSPMLGKGRVQSPA
eukprot:m.52357 g.52357  ORF g.52357 m.52357 type:complete len:302 (-) comp12287_c0_seq2:861-1766(-)